MPGVAEPQLDPHSQILDAYWENNKNLLSGKGYLKNRFLSQIKIAMVINGEFLVSVSSGLTSGGPLALGRGWEEQQAGGGSELLEKPRNAMLRDGFQRDVVKSSLGLGQKSGGVVSLGS